MISISFFIKDYIEEMFNLLHFYKNASFQSEKPENKFEAFSIFSVENIKSKKGSRIAFWLSNLFI